MSRSQRKLHEFSPHLIRELPKSRWGIREDDEGIVDGEGVFAVEAEKVEKEAGGGTDDVGGEEEEGEEAEFKDDDEGEEEGEVKVVRSSGSAE